MRFALVRCWAVVAAAMLTGAVADATTEFAGNSHWLIGSVRDDQHQSVVPALALGATIAIALLLFVVLARISPRDARLARMNDARRRVGDIAAALCGSALCVVTMEGYETRFGGLSPFDPRSVVLSHAFALIVAFVVVGTMLHYLLRGAIGMASRAGTIVARVVVAFLRKLLGTTASARAVSLSIFALHVSPTALDGTVCSRGLRAPPRLLPLLNMMAV